MRGVDFVLILLSAIILLKVERIAELHQEIGVLQTENAPQKGAGEMNKVKWISNTLKKDKDDIYRPVQSMIEPTKPKDALQYAMMNLERKKDKKNDRTC